jgi:hypothetical protein
MTKYRRKWACALCGQDVIFERVMNGWTVTCGCGTQIREKGPNVEQLEEIIDVLVEKLEYSDYVGKGPKHLGDV